MFILCVKYEFIDVFVGVDDKFDGEFGGQTFVYLPVPPRTSIHSCQDLSPKVLVGPTWTVHARNMNHHTQ